MFCVVFVFVQRLWLMNPTLEKICKVKKVECSLFNFPKQGISLVFEKVHLLCSKSGGLWFIDL